MVAGDMLLGELLPRRTRRYSVRITHHGLCVAVPLFVFDRGFRAPTAGYFSFNYGDAAAYG